MDKFLCETARHFLCLIYVTSNNVDKIIAVIHMFTK